MSELAGSLISVLMGVIATLAIAAAAASLREWRQRHRYRDLIDSIDFEQLYERTERDR